MRNMTQEKKKLIDILLNQIDLSRTVKDEEIFELIDELLVNESKKINLNLQLEERLRLRKELFHSLRKLDILQELVDDVDVTEIMINGPENVFIEKAGKLKKYPLSFESKEKLEDVIQQIVSGCNRVVNEASPIVDARLQDGSRVNIVLYPIALNGPIMTIRKFPEKPIVMENLIQFGSISREITVFLENLVKAKYNIFISGGTGSGKTTFLNALSNYIPHNERIITIEDNAELQLVNIENLVTLETRNANVEGCREISIRELIKSSLRMRPDRIVVGEVRGGEAFDMMQALNTGHDGSMSTGHANSSKDMLSRLENMILMGMELPLDAIRQQIGSGLDIIVHLGRLRDGSRKLLEIVEILGFENQQIKSQVLYQFEEIEENEKGKIVGIWKKKEKLRATEKLRAAGLSITEL